MSEEILDNNLNKNIKEVQEDKVETSQINNTEEVKGDKVDTSKINNTEEVQGDKVDTSQDNSEAGQGKIVETSQIDKIDKQDTKIDVSKISEVESIFDEESKTKTSATKKTISILFAFLAVFFVIGFSIYTVLTVDNSLPIVITLNYSTEEQYTQTIKKGSTFVIPADPTRTGYQFMGWFADADFDTEFDFTKPIKTDTTIYVKWVIKKYTLSFRPNTTDPNVDFNFRGTVFASDFEVIFDSNFIIPSDAGGLGSGSKTFVKWNTASDGSGTSYMLGDTLKMPARDLFLFAIWE